MPDTKPKTKSAVPRPVKSSPSIKTPRYNIPGRLSDEVFEKVEHAIRTMTPEEFKSKLIEFGITDKKGRFYSAMARK
jgi:hypothetical protein